MKLISNETVEQILSLTAEGLSFKSVCTHLNLDFYRTAVEFRRSDSLTDRLAEARAIAVDSQLDELVKLSNTPCVDNVEVSHLKLKIDTVMQLAKYNQRSNRHTIDQDRLAFVLRNGKRGQLSDGQSVVPSIIERRIIDVRATVEPSDCQTVEPSDCIAHVYQSDSNTDKDEL